MRNRTPGTLQNGEGAPRGDPFCLRCVSPEGWAVPQSPPITPGLTGGWKLVRGETAAGGAGRVAAALGSQENLPAGRATSAAPEAADRPGAAAPAPADHAKFAIG